MAEPAKAQATAEQPETKSAAQSTAQPATTTAPESSTPAEPQAIEREEQAIVPANDSDRDSLYSAGGFESFTQSLTSSVLAYTHENGRQYHSYRAGTYWGPNDDTALDGLDMDHHIFMLAMNGQLHLAPIGEAPGSILDLGTGTGIWAIEMGDKYPSASVTGNDLAPTQPAQVPPNVQFEIDDFCDEWTYAPNSFDFIHAAQILGCVDSYPKLFGKVLNCLRPGGWYEQVEIDVLNYSEDGSVKDSPLEKMGKLCVEAGEKMGKPLRFVDKTKQAMIDAGFVDVTEVIYKLPIGPWPKDERLKQIGMCNVISYHNSMEGWLMRPFVNFLGWEPMEVQVFSATVRNALKDKSLHAVEDLRVCYGRKPLGPSTADEPEH